MAFIKSVSSDLSNHAREHNTDSDRHDPFTPRHETVTVSPSTQIARTSLSCCVDSGGHLCKGSARGLACSKLSVYTTLTIFIKGANPL